MTPQPYTPAEEAAIRAWLDDVSDEGRDELRRALATLDRDREPLRRQELWPRCEHGAVREPCVPCAEFRPAGAVAGLDVERLAKAMEPVTRALIIGGGDKSLDQWRHDTAVNIAAEYARLTEARRG